MLRTEKPILDVLHGKRPERIPVWLMRQAGRYLPEYRKLRARAGGFLDLCLTPEWAAEITLQPIRRFDLDAAIIFADILLIPLALGQKLEFREGEGPVLEKVSDENDVAGFNYDENKIAAVFETLRRVKKDLPEQTALIGFCGGLWTVACYMTGGSSKNGFAETLGWTARRPEALQRLIDILLEASLEYLSGQVGAGAEVIQIFDSWAGLLDGEAFDRWVTKPTQKLISRFREKHPHIPVIGFPREATPKDYSTYVRHTGVDALSLDTRVDLDYAQSELQSVKPLQGNLDPALLVKGGAEMRNGIEAILTKLGPTHIVNLGHGVVPQTPPEHVAELVKIVRGWKTFAKNHD